MSSCSAMTFFIIDVWTSLETLADAAAMDHCAMLLEIPSMRSSPPPKRSSLGLSAPHARDMIAREATRDDGLARGGLIMDWTKILETMMLVCFGAAWPLSILKSWRARTAKGKSFAFLCVILAGYVAGIAKVLISDGPGGFLLIPYSINFAMVSTDACLWIRNRRFDREAREG